MKYYACYFLVLLALILCQQASVAHTPKNGSHTSSCCCSTTVSKLPFIQFFKNNLLWSQGTYIAALLMALLIAGFMLNSSLLTLIAVSLWIFSLYFFRSPDRSYTIPAGHTPDEILICPADGKVVDIVDISDDFVGAESQRVSIFLSPLDVHVQWTPCSGIIKQIVYRPGAFMVAYAPKSSDINERNDLYLEDAHGKRIIVRQIAGFVARRICWWVEENEHITGGTKYGMIRFGSRVDIIVPKTVHIQVTIGQRVFGGQTILGMWQ